MSDYTPTTKEVKDVYNLGLLDVGNNVDVKEALAMFDRWLAARDEEVAASALEEFAGDLRDRYPVDVFRPMTDVDHKAVNDAISGRKERTHVSRDRVSADMMRRAAAQAIEQAAEYRKTDESEASHE